MINPLVLQFTPSDFLRKSQTLSILDQDSITNPSEILNKNQCNVSAFPHFWFSVRADHTLHTENQQKIYICIYPQGIKLNLAWSHMEGIYPKNYPACPGLHNCLTHCLTVLLRLAVGGR